MAQRAGGEGVSDSILVELTPPSLRCSIGACPSVYRIGQEKKLLIVGKKPSGEIAELIKNKIGEDEWAIVVDPELLSEI